MSTRTRCKFRVSSITHTLGYKDVLDEAGEKVLDENGKAKMEEWHQPRVNLSAVYADGDPESENSKFWTATPTGTIELSINNPLGAEVFEIGREYYVDFLKA